MSAPRSRKPDKRPSPVNGHQLLTGLANLRQGLRQWMLANMPTGGGMTVPRATLLFGLSLKPDAAGMSELGESLGMSPRNMTVLVDGLEKEGLVRRVGHQHDRRIKLVELTPIGKQVAEQEVGPSLASAATLFDDFTADERASFLKLLEKLADSLRARGIEVKNRDRG